MTSVERREPTTMSTSGGQVAERGDDIPAPRKCTASLDAIGERKAKRTRSPRPSEASSASSPPAVGATGQAKRLEERARTRGSLGPVSVHGRQPEDAPPAAPIDVPRAKGRGVSRAEQESVGSTPPRLK